MKEEGTVIIWGKELWESWWREERAHESYAAGLFIRSLNVSEIPR